MSPESPRLFIRMGLPSALRSDIGQGETGVTGGSCSAVMTLARLAVNHRGPARARGSGRWDFRSQISPCLHGASGLRRNRFGFRFFPTMTDEWHALLCTTRARAGAWLGPCARGVSVWNTSARTRAAPNTGPREQYPIGATPFRSPNVGASPRLACAPLIRPLRAAPALQVDLERLAERHPTALSPRSHRRQPPPQQQREQCRSKQQSAACAIASAPP